MHQKVLGKQATCGISTVCSCGWYLVFLLWALRARASSYRAKQTEQADYRGLVVTRTRPKSSKLTFPKGYINARGLLRGPRLDLWDRLSKTQFLGASHYSKRAQSPSWILQSGLVARSRGLSLSLLFNCPRSKSAHLLLLIPFSHGLQASLM